ncbi:MAG: short-chain dehydrogenase [Rhodobacterales bacterium]|nr:MAG: short-chain dehydrogenase [Rhodobacterales bacterium]
MTRSILITGCSSGIGYDAAHTLAQRGWRVFATCRQEKDCARLRDEGLIAPRLDHTDPESIAAALAEATADGPLDAIFANGAFAMPGALEDLPTGGLREIFETNLFGVHELVRQTLPHFRANGGGRIVLCSSVLGYFPYKWRGAYTSTKFALEGYGDVLRLEMADAGIHVSLIEPGPITSRIRENAIPHFERWFDWRASPRAAQYEGDLLPRLYDDTAPKDRFELPASAVTDVLIHAVESPRPRARYRVTRPAKIGYALKRVLTTRALDRLLRKLD